MSIKHWKIWRSNLYYVIVTRGLNAFYLILHSYFSQRLTEKLEQDFYILPD